jgi:hypothetical protein
MKIVFLIRASITILIIGLIISCTETEASHQEVYSAISSAATTVSYTPEVKIKTSKKIQGNWKTFSSGTKVKWSIVGNKLYKNTIYSFGEIGEPQVFDIDFKNDCDGVSDEYGEMMTLTLKNNKEKRSVCYSITKKSEESIHLKSAYGQTLVLEKM